MNAPLDTLLQLSPTALGVGLPPLMTREAWSAAIGLPLEVVRFQCNKGYWPCIRVGKYSLINVEAIRAKALERANEFVLGRNGTR
ncbi:MULTISPECIES: hypothetical protein [Burkholderia]|uniref:hypothetical protein n=1 Tax=Burkholderia TaxID=32008 RepID=UPI000B0D5893|nr:MULTISPECIES: hypothetical protein [Burkholderia]